MELRQASLADAETIAEIHTASWRSTYAAVLDAAYLADAVPSERSQLWVGRLGSADADRLVMVAEIEDRIAGFACVLVNHHVAWGAYLDSLHVRASYRGRGVGRALLAEMARWCASRSPGTGLYLSVNQDNARAQRFYRGLGACNAEPGIWNAPDGSKVATYWFRWRSVESLAYGAGPRVPDDPPATVTGELGP